MMISRFSNNHAAERVAEIEEKYKVSLPNQYRNFLCTHNGGDTPNTDYKAGRASTVVRGFYGFGDVRYSLDKMDLQEWIEKGLFPIACDPFGNEIAISLGAEDNGSVCFLNHEKGYAKSRIAKYFRR